MKGSYPPTEMTINDEGRDMGSSRNGRQTVEDWLKVADENAVACRMASATYKLGDLGTRGGVGLRAVYLSGPPGVGKTHSIVEQEEIWAACGIKPLRFRPRNVGELLDQFKIAGGRRPLIMEEADIIFRSKPMFEILKQATDPLTPDIFYRVEKVEGEKAAVPINLNVPIVVSTNMDLGSDVGWDKNLLADRDALFNRSRPVIIPDDPFALWEWSIYLALTSHLTRDFVIRNRSGGLPLVQANSLAVQAQAIDWFTDNVNKLEVISPRTLKQVAQSMGRTRYGDMPPAILAEELDGHLGKERADPIPVPAKADWGVLLRGMPKQLPAGAKVTA
ncbi:AAA family ATPase [Rhizorhabdus histidinilytica]|uniref:AAA family ATPase n=1 Tax=Rhizorhabdus histidinilytica TaxID=439228 RepID=UPI0011161D44|nr:AAA family ATPase [Rhizorhabdus histidinilytica]